MPLTVARLLFTFRIILPLSLIMSALTVMLLPAVRVITPPLPVTLFETILLLTVISVFASSVTAVPALVLLVIAIGLMDVGEPVAKESDVIVVTTPVDSTVILSGSSNKLPPFPSAAPASTNPIKSSSPLLDTSTAPPSPDTLPPLALMLPPKAVWSFDHRTTLPPLPASRASAEILTSVPTTAALALRTEASFPWNPPPIFTVPPPASPDTSTTALSNSPTLSPVITTAPPVSP